jgi:hypothetical protein
MCAYRGHYMHFLEAVRVLVEAMRVFVEVVRVCLKSLRLLIEESLKCL